jgi:hypothetical protein
VHRSRLHCREHPSFADPCRLEFRNCAATYPFKSFDYLLSFWERLSEAQMIAQIFD